MPPMAEELRMQIQHTNMQVVNCSTPANYFHVLRRQIQRAFRKPLIIATPKSLLRHKSAVSSLSDMAEGSFFQRVIPDTLPALASSAGAKKVRKVVFCTGKVYYDLAKHRADSNIHDVALVRVEQIAPFPFDLVAEQIKRYPNASVTWAQEEPRNMGAWTYVAPRIMTATRVLLGKEITPVRCTVVLDLRCFIVATVVCIFILNDMFMRDFMCRCMWADWQRHRRQLDPQRSTTLRLPRSWRTRLHRLLSD